MKKYSPIQKVVARKDYICDATENNIKLAEDMVNHTATADRKFDEFRPGESKRALEDIMSIADMVIID